MLRSNWLHTVLGLTRTRKDRRSQAAAQQRRVLLRLEPMEDRITPSATIAASHWPPDPHIAVANALASETATNDYLLQILNSYITSVGGQTNDSTASNGSSLFSAAQAAVISTLTAMSQNLMAINKELSSTNLPPSEVALLQVLMQSQLPLTVQAQIAQQNAASSSNVAVGALTN